MLNRVAASAQRVVDVLALHFSSMDPAIPPDAISRADIQRRTERIESLLRSMDGLIGAMGRILDTFVHISISCDIYNTDR